MANYKYNWREVPDDPEENAAWRAKTLDYANKAGGDAAEFRSWIMERCRKDFWY
jgi:hypothetical protein